MFSTAINSHVNGLERSKAVEFHSVAPSSSPVRRLSGSFKHRMSQSDIHTSLASFHGTGGKCITEHVDEDDTSSMSPEKTSENQLVVAASTALRERTQAPPRPKPSPTLKNMIDPSLFENIQKGFDEYEGTRRQQEDIIDEIEIQMDNQDITVRARQAFVANSYDVNNRIKNEMSRVGQKQAHSNKIPIETKLEALLTTSRSVHSIRRMMRSEIGKESNDLTSMIDEWYEINPTNTTTRLEHIPEHISNTEGNNLSDLEAKLLKLLLRKQRHLKQSSRVMLKSGKLSKKTRKKILEESSEGPNRFLKSQSLSGASLPFTEDGGATKHTKRKKKKRNKALKYNLTRVPKTRKGRIELAMSIISAPAKMSKATKRRLYAKEEVRKRSEEALRRRSAMQEKKPYREIWCYPV